MFIFHAHRCKGYQLLEHLTKRGDTKNEMAFTMGSRNRWLGLLVAAVGMASAGVLASSSTCMTGNRASMLVVDKRTTVGW